ncbi:hypothetical protein M9Y10_031057 [Tritrichomonas musculus]|uniref:Myb-like DNA-binding domain containing protein n=1 Tax=Tritrichomonas musculus TaxID=1915356 RepID=A0ABR2H1N4_9EUKA
MITFPNKDNPNKKAPKSSIQKDHNNTDPINNFFAPVSQFSFSNPFNMNFSNSNNESLNNISQNNHDLPLSFPQQNGNKTINNKKINPAKKGRKENIGKTGVNIRSANDNINPALHYPKKTSRIHFSAEEDEKIKELVKKFGTKKWTIVSKFMNGRTAKQCRDRYSNYLLPGIFHGEWTEEEDKLLTELYNRYGSKWSIIHNFFPKRSSNSIKNHWNYFLNKSVDEEVEDNKEIEKNDGQKETINNSDQLDTKNSKNELTKEETIKFGNEQNGNNISHKKEENKKSFNEDFEIDFKSDDNDDWDLFD